VITAFDIADRNIVHWRKRKIHTFECPTVNNFKNKKKAQTCVEAIMTNENVGI
jgi:hypothetical protein